MNNFIPKHDEALQADYLIIGAGIVGMTIARELALRDANKKIVVIEKENEVAAHSSGRNSGVLHAGFYYTADSLKARFTREGNAAMRRYCAQNHLRINLCGKVVVTRNETEIAPLLELEKRGRANGVDLQLINEKELAQIEPNALTFRHALYSPTTATVSPPEVNLCIKNEIVQRGVTMLFGEKYIARTGTDTIRTERREISAKKIINAAGLYADRIARDFGFSKRYIIIPFKGVYLQYSGNDQPVHTNIYPVPNLLNPFLGVHYTVTVDNHIKIGPTSIPAFWRENYNGMENFCFAEMAEILSWEAVLFLCNSFHFRQLAIEEVKKYNRRYFTQLAKDMVQHIDTDKFNHWIRPGIRAQLLQRDTRELVMDFVVEGDNTSTHILNAVSPAFTCSFPFARWVVESFVD